MPNITRLHLLDALRGVAALAVVFWHWQHFFFVGTSISPQFNNSDQPLYAIFFIFYRHGELAVDLFFSLSGFIFFWLYAQSISEQKVHPIRFFILRFSRLYPLHILTFLLVACGQLIYWNRNSSTFVYSFHDLRHAILNIFLLPSVGLEHGFSFNAPIWSVSIEVVLYVIFFLLCYVRLNRPLVLASLSILGFFILDDYYQPISRGIGSFFLGGLIYYIYAAIARSSIRGRIGLMVSSFTAAMWVTTILFVYKEIPLQGISFVWWFSTRFPIMVLFPLTILSLALIETVSEINAQCFSFLGNISYSSYLLHFPIQLAFILVVQNLGGGKTFFTTNTSLVLYFSVLLILSWLSYHYFEMPAQQYLRKRWLPSCSSGEPTVGRPTAP